MRVRPMLAFFAKKWEHLPSCVCRTAGLGPHDYFRGPAIAVLRSDVQLLVVRARRLAGDATCNKGFYTISPTRTNPTTTAKPAFKTGQRTLHFALKYYF